MYISSFAFSYSLLTNLVKMDGLQATRHIRKWEREQYAQLHDNDDSEDGAMPLEIRFSKSNKRARIIALTADVMPGVSEECEAAGMDGFLTKPLDYRNLLRVVKEVCDSVK